MKKATTLLNSLFLLEMICAAQDSIIILHPVLGEIIDRNEKTALDLFPEIATSKFEYGYILEKEGIFWLKSRLYPDSMLARPIDTAEIHQLERDIEAKITDDPELLINKTGPGGLRSVVVIPPEADQSNAKIMYPGTIESITNEVIVDERLKDDAEMFRLWKQGSNFDNAGMYIDFSYRKKKKK